MWKFIKDLAAIHGDRARAKKALRILSKQEWSVEFLVYLLRKAVDISKQEMFVTIKNQCGNSICIHAGSPGQAIVTREQELDVLNGKVTLDALLNAAEINGGL